jgi:hypothetical protein
MKALGIATLCATVISLGAAIVGSSPEKNLALEPQDGQYLHECPHDGISGRKTWKTRPGYLAFDPITLQGSGRITLSGAIQEIPEFHDCQRFILRSNGGEYGALVSIFAPENLESIFGSQPTPKTARPATSPLQLPGRAGAASEDTAQIRGPLRPTAVATIVSWDRAHPEYAPLGLKLGVSCLYMGKDERGKWEAFHQANGFSADCPKQPRERAPRFNLSVLENDLPRGLVPSDVPPVARWDWDPVNQEQYLNIRCGNRLCEVGRVGFARSPDLTPPSQFTGTSATRVFLIKGWYDRQILAEVKTNADGTNRLVPTMQIGVVVPFPRVDAYRNADFVTADPGRPVALLYVERAIYKPATWNLQPGMPPAITNVMTAYTTDSNTLRPMSGRIRQWASFATDGSFATATAETTGPGYGINITFRGSEWGKTHHIPGTARWRWEATDETTWFRCPFGCCEGN